ncbi:hypothetical protein MATL_G00031160 [Megalops atlanticus]|uniref:Immunoglobulin V-set domain-containing protein n=1 Tax=Megalops atlanticus TaxID=7932 RepID=A0A9D3TK05_MEGAT|nr:hypothetical protein MATL_G00031160 [Megalops atlanticus]
MSNLQSMGVMRHPTKQLFSLPLLLVLLLCEEHIQAEEITGTTGKKIKIRFTFKNLSHIHRKTVNLYKGSQKIAECNDMKTVCVHGRYVLEEGFQDIILNITNLTSSDAGTYYVAMIPQTLTPIESGRVSLILSSGEPFTVTPPTSLNTGNVYNKTSPSGSSVYIYIIAAFGVITVVLPTVLLAWFYLTRVKHSDDQLHQATSTKFQVASEVSNSMPIYSIEYVMLDFHNRPKGREKDWRSDVGLKPQDNVEYASITFPPGHRQTDVQQAQRQFCWETVQYAHKKRP